MGRSFRRNSLQMQKPDLHFIPGKNNELCREKSGGPGAHLFRLLPPPLPPLEKAGPVSKLSTCKRDYETAFFILLDFSSCTICNSL